MAKIDHTNCTHPRTPAGRRACRAAVASGTTLDMTPVRSEEIDRQVRVFSGAFNKAKIQAKSERIQPRRSGARVSATSSTCVQAALHSSRGLCACGHVSGGFVRAS